MQENTYVTRENLNKVERKSGRLSLAENYLLIWLDTNFNESHEDYSHSLQQLKQFVNTINTYSDYDQCLEFVHKANDENIFLILSGSLGEQVIGDIHPISQIDSIYLFCHDRQKHEQWTQQWPKIKGVFSDIESVCNQLRKDSRQCERDSTSFEVINESDLNQLEPTFIYTNLFKDIILEMKYEKKDWETLVNHCRLKYQDNKIELKVIKQFETKYAEHSAIWWYTRNCFTYHVLNRSLGTFEVDMILSFGPFIQDLHRHLQQLHSAQKPSFPPIFTVYRGQGLSKTDFDKLKQSSGGLLSFNNFLSTSKNRTVSYGFAQGSLNKPGHVAILFQMKIDSSMDKSPFASLDEESFYEDTEQEILFSMNSVFRVGSVEEIDDSQIYQVELTLTSSDIDPQFQLFYQHTQKEIQGLTAQDRLAQLLIKLGYAEKAEPLYKSLIEKTSEDDYQEYSHLNHMLAVSYLNQAKYPEAIALYQKVIQFIEKYLPDERAELARAYATFGETYEQLGEFFQALKYFGKSLEIREEALPPDHLDLATSYILIGNMYQRLGECQKAVEHYTKALQIRQKSLPAIHLDIAIALNNLATVYCGMQDFPKAKEYLQKSDEITRKCLPSLHPWLIVHNSNLALVYQGLGENIQAVQYSENALKMKEKFLPANDLRIAAEYNCMGLAYHNICDHEKALEFFLKALNMRQTSDPENLPEFALIYNNIGDAHTLMGQFDQALEYLQKSVDIKLNLNPPAHSDLIYTYMNISGAYRRLGNVLKTIEFTEKAIELQQIVQPPNHPSLVENYLSVAEACEELKDYPKSMKYQEKINEILIRKSLPRNNRDLAQNYHNIAFLYRCMTDYDQALIFYQRAIEIQDTCLPQNNSTLILFYQNTVELYLIIGEYFQAIEFNQKLLEFLEPSLPQNQEEWHSAHETKANLYYRLKDYPNALKWFSQLLQKAEQTVPFNYAELFIYNSRITEIYFLMGQGDQGQRTFQNCLDILQISSNLYLVRGPVFCLGSLYSAANDYQTAINYFQKALQLEIQSSSEETYVMGEIFSQIGNLQQLTGDYQNALISLQKALDIQENLICLRTDLALTYNYCGESHRKMKNYPQALESLEKALKLRQQLSYYYHPDLADVYRNFAEVYHDIGQANLAYEYIQKAIDIIRQTLSQSHPLFSHYLQTLNKIQQLLTQ